MMPLGLSAADAVSRLGPFLSFGSAVELLRTHADHGAAVIYDGPPSSGSSLTFYLDRQHFVIDEPRADATPRASGSTYRLTVADAVEKLGAAQPVFLVTHKTRVPDWQERLTARYHIYHQVSTCGDYVIVSNQP